MNSSSNALLQQIAENLKPLEEIASSLNGVFTKNFITFIVGAFSGIFVSFISFILQHWLKRKYQKPIIKAVKVISKFQKFQYVYRLLLINKSEYLAKRVEVDIIDVIDPNQIKRDFIPAPLRWTHGSEKPRDIFPHQPAYLDLCEVKQETGRFITLVAPNLAGLDEMLIIKKGVTVINLHYYEESGQLGKIKLEIKWNGMETFENEQNLPKINLK